MFTSPPPRLFVILARDAPLGVVLCRGPSAWAHLVLWATRGDVFTPGAWFRGRIYEDKCDLSPDGQRFVYAAHQGSRAATSYTSSWTAVSRPPWLHALALWPMSTTYGGGGRFIDNRRLMVRGAGKLHPDHPPGGLTARQLEVVSGNAELHRSTEEVAGTDWIGRDQANQLIYASQGRLFRRTGHRDIELADFNGMAPAPQPAPALARRPL